MARKPRLYSNSGIYHVIVRGNNEQNIFYDDADRRMFLNRLGQYAQELNISIYSYCLMSNHVHLLIGDGNKNMSRFVQKLLTSYVRRFNTKYERSGHLFQGRFLSKPVEDDKRFKVVVRYILQNPEKAGMEKHDIYIWSSFQHLVSEKEEPIINKQYVMEIFSGKEAFKNFVALPNEDICMEYKGKIPINDKRCINMIRTLIKGDSPDSLCKMEISEQRNKIRILRGLGISISQLSRVTGLSIRCIREA